MSIQPRKLKGRTVYRVMVKDLDGDWMPVKTFDTKAEAREHEAVLISSRSKGERAKGKHAGKHSPWSDYWAKWSAECRTKVGAGWKKSQDQMHRDHVEPYLKGKTLAEIDKSDIALLMAKLHDEKKLGAQTRLHVFNLLHKMFDDAIEVYDYRESNPVLDRFKPAIDEIIRPFYKPHEAMEFLDKVSADPFGPAFWIMIFCGFRTGEMQMLQHGDIHLNEGYIQLSRQWIRRESRPGPLKGGKAARIPVPQELGEYLRQALPRDASPTDYLVKGRAGGMASAGLIYKKVVKLTAELGAQRLSPHELRHTCSVLWKSFGASLSDRKQVLNQKSEASAKRYDHDVDERLNEISGRMVRAGKAGKLALVK